VVRRFARVAVMEACESRRRTRDRGARRRHRLRDGDLHGRQHRDAAAAAVPGRRTLCRFVRRESDAATTLSSGRLSPFA
jgi:hypothetical protein